MNSGLTNDQTIPDESIEIRVAKDNSYDYLGNNMRYKLLQAHKEQQDMLRSQSLNQRKQVNEQILMAKQAK